MDSGAKSLSQFSVLDIGSSYFLSYTGTVDTGTLGMQTNGGAVGSVYRLTPSVNSIAEPWVCDASGIILKRQSTVNNGTLDNVSVKKLIEVAS